MDGMDGELLNSVLVEHADGASVAKTPYYKGLEEEPWGGSMGIKRLEPGETEVEHVSINELYNISAPGSYRVRVMQGHNVSSLSNVVIFNVLP
jgi:hypothetical protein